MCHSVQIYSILRTSALTQALWVTVRHKEDMGWQGLCNGLDSIQAVYFSLRRDQPLLSWSVTQTSVGWLSPQTHVSLLTAVHATLRPLGGRCYHILSLAYSYPLHKCYWQLLKSSIWGLRTNWVVTSFPLEALPLVQFRAPIARSHVSPSYCLPPLWPWPPAGSLLPAECGDGVLGAGVSIYF